MRTAEPLRRFVRTVEGDPRLDRVTTPLDRLASAISGLRGGEAGSALRGDGLGHALHPLMTDLPLGCWTSAGVLDLVGGRSSRDAARRLVGLGLLAVPLTVASGIADYDTIDRQDVRRAGALHAVGNGAVAALYLLSWRQRRRRRHVRGVVLGLAGGSLAMVTGYLGGHLSFARGAGVDPRGDLDLPDDPNDDARMAARLEGLEARGRAHLVDVTPEMRITIVET